jgi:hypothetical protein
MLKRARDPKNNKKYIENMYLLLESLPLKTAKRMRAVPKYE